MEDFFDIGAADAAGGDFDEDFAVGDFRNGDFFDADEAFSAVDAGAHGFGDGGEGVRRFEGGEDAAHVAETSSTSDAQNPGHFAAIKGMYLSRKSASDTAAARL